MHDNGNKFKGTSVRNCAYVFFILLDMIEKTLKKSKYTF